MRSKVHASTAIAAVAAASFALLASSSGISQTASQTTSQTVNQTANQPSSSRNSATAKAHQPSPKSGQNHNHKKNRARQAVKLSAKPLGSKEPFWDYPELLAVPSASTLVKEYARDEPSQSFNSYLPMQIMALGNVVVGIKAMGEDVVRDSKGKVVDNPKLAGQIALGIGLATIGGTYLLSEMYTPYRDGVRNLKRRGGATAKARLAKEREAEHIINNAASTAQSVRAIGLLANLAGAGMVIANSDNRNTGVAAGLTIISGIGAFMFTPYQIELPGRYDGYKKRIYGPISYLSPNMTGESIAGNLGLQLRF